jgi:hypothetical protein
MKLIAIGHVIVTKDGNNEPGTVFEIDDKEAEGLIKQGFAKKANDDDCKAQAEAARLAEEAEEAEKARLAAEAVEKAEREAKAAAEAEAEARKSLEAKALELNVGTAKEIAKMTDDELKAAIEESEALL